MLVAEGTGREEIGREQFEQRVWEWREHYGSTIVSQFQRLGASCDYSDERFTLDDGYVEAVLKVFVDLFDKGLIYRDHYMVNWDPGSGSAISDLEVEDREVTDTLYYIDYPLESGDGVVTVATVRPETMLADTAVAVNPDDERYTEHDRQDSCLADCRAQARSDRRRLRQDRLRHRGAQDHARARSQRLRDRPPSRARGDLGDRRGRSHERQRRRVRRHEGGRGVGRDRRGTRARGSHLAHRGLHAHRSVLAPLGRADRAADLVAVVHEDGRAGRARDRGRQVGQGQVRSRALGPRLPRLAREHQAVVCLAPTLVGPPSAGLVLRRLR